MRFTYGKFSRVIWIGDRKKLKMFMEKLKVDGRPYGIEV